MSKICPYVRADMICRRSGCSLIHAVYRCRSCRAPFATQTSCAQHEKSRASAHAQKTVYRCTICSIISSSRTDYNSHVEGRKHKKMLSASRQQEQVTPTEMDVPPHHVPCTVCNTFVAESNWTTHILGQRHRAKQMSQSLTNALNMTEDDKHGVRIDGDGIDFGTVDGTAGTVTVSKQIRVANKGSFTVVLSNIKLSTTRSNIFRVIDATRRRQLDRTNVTTVTLKLSASKGDRGTFENRAEFYFEIPSQQRRFAITRTITARVGSKSDYEELRPTKPYIQRMRTRRGRITRFFSGIRPQALAKIVWARKLKKFEIPNELEAILSPDDLKTSEKLSIVRSTFIQDELGPTTYAKCMQLRLWLEEEHASRELSEYDMQDVQLASKGIYYDLAIPGLAEKRPSVIFGDRFFVSESGSSDSVPFEGFVHEVKNKSVLLRFNKKFKWSIGHKYDVHFDLNRLVFRRMHQAVMQKTEASRIAFPSLTRELQPVSISSVMVTEPYDSKIASNEPQRRAVTSIVRMPPGSVPFIIYGPPGTGKTVTLVEAIRQVVARKPGARILACAPSNSAADIIVERLAEHLSVLGDKPLFRLTAPSRSSNLASSTVLRFTRVNDHGVFECPSRKELEAFRVVVSTCCSGGVPYGIGFEPGHFTHIFIDEAAQASEPEVMIPIKTMLGPNTNVILSGDIKQLGPIIRSPIARELGLGVSLVERLMSISLYDEARAKGRSMIKLTKNYRSHPAILEFPNAEFYKNELEACAGREITHCIAGRWEGLVKKDYPLVFHGICGQDMREDPSPSYFNIDEAIVVKDYVKSLLDGDMQLVSGDIGIITPYRAQVLKIRQLLRSLAPDTRVGSVEEFQGQERKVIIISTVRSSPDKIAFDIRHTLGFVASPRRFNVAVTRAQALVVVVGDPYVLSLDPMWKVFINHIHVRGGYTGVTLDWDPAEPVDRAARLDEARRAQGQFELEELIRRTTDLDLGDDVVEDPGAFREEE